jgi:methenyltetrahydromethanopterin cyclohydrolase
LCDRLASVAEELQVFRLVLPCGATVYDFGIDASGSLSAGVFLARVCLADLAEVEAGVGCGEDWPWTGVEVSTEHPVAACLASQYAGWEIRGEDFFAMGSGPMRAAAAREPLFEAIGFRERAEHCVGVLEASTIPPNSVALELAGKCHIAPENLTLLVAPTTSSAGTVQVVARSVETALHKLHELGFDLRRIRTGRGTAPLPPVTKDLLAAIGRTNDAILYAGQVALEVTGDDASLTAIGPRVPSSASPEFGRPFAEIMSRYDNDFYRIDPLLFSASRITFLNRDTGNSFGFGELRPDLIRQSFGE